MPPQTKNNTNHKEKQNHKHTLQTTQYNNIQQKQQITIQKQNQTQQQQLYNYKQKLINRIMQLKYNNETHTQKR